MKMVMSDAAKLAEKLRELGLTLSIAESCTGGMISSMLTELPGASEFFLGSAVTYSNDSKIDILNVCTETLKEYGAVSKETAKEMAIGARTIFRSDISASVTGIAGPSGGTESKPLGLVFIAVFDGTDLRVFENHFEGYRKDIQHAAAIEVISIISELIG
jgi:competence/damage-inducible protein CinA C-terminal domain